MATPAGQVSRGRRGRDTLGARRSGGRKQQGRRSGRPCRWDWWRIRDSNPGPADYDSVAL